MCITILVSPHPHRIGQSAACELGRICLALTLTWIQMQTQKQTQLRALTQKYTLALKLMRIYVLTLSVEIYTDVSMH